MVKNDAIPESHMSDGQPREHVERDEVAREGAGGSATSVGDPACAGPRMTAVIAALAEQRRGEGGSEERAPRLVLV